MKVINIRDVFAFYCSNRKTTTRNESYSNNVAKFDKKEKTYDK